MSKNNSGVCTRKKTQVYDIYLKIFKEYRCFYCNKRLIRKDPTRESKTTLDHFIPKCYGGKDSIANLVISCDECNRTKGCSAVKDQTFINKLREIHKEIFNFYKENKLNPPKGLSVDSV